MPFAVFPIDVHLTGGQPWWRGLIGPALLAATAIIAAWIAANTANKRQAAQLAHDRELQAEQLAYDREQRNRQHVRDAVDEAVRGIDAAVRVLFQYEARIVEGDQERNRRRGLLADEAGGVIPKPAILEALIAETTEIQADSDAAYDASIEMTSQNLRLALRLGDKHPIVKAHQAFRDAYSTRHDALVHLYQRPLTDEDRAGIRNASQVGNAIMASFTKSCREWFEEG